ncbi:MAG: glutamine synthetase III [Phycisphaerae bacterium]|nr:glutamine synthetase III [Phycisphaerae bacterium]
MSIKNEVVTEIFGSNVFNDAVMRERLPKETYTAVRKAIENREALDFDLATVIANVMKDWAIEKGATHYSHWFQPMTGLTAEKHDSFISPTSDGKIIMDFSGKELCQGEPDASSFPSGGLRATFEARGYTAWDYTSPVFIKADGTNVTLYIPSAFCSYTGLALDKKTPLLRSMDALNKEASRVLAALGDKDFLNVSATLGPEQEYFLIDRSYYERRLDLILTGRTLFGVTPPRGQEMDDHYFGTLQERVASYMHEVNIELWKLGVSAKTQHNEVAPSQYELAPVFSTINVATDHNQLTMEVLQKVAIRHDLVCLLHEKPFAGVNGSGKHVNWSMSTGSGVNLLEPGKTPHDNMIFLLMLCTVIRAVDKYADILRASVATAGNDHRLGANEAPPAIISIFLGDQLTDILEQLAKGSPTSSKQAEELMLGTSAISSFAKDCTDRNRTSPFAFTGNKFEFRMPGSTQSTAGPSFVLNTIVSEVLSEIADELEAAKDPKDRAWAILKRISTEHKHIVFNGDNYTDKWLEEAEKRGLAHHPTTISSLKTITSKQNVELFSKHNVLNSTELHARADILIEAYSMKINIEAKTMLNIAKRQILPVCVEYSSRLGCAVGNITAVGSSAEAQKTMLDRTCGLINELHTNIQNLEKVLAKADDIAGLTEKAEYFQKDVIKEMIDLRTAADELETIVDAELWPLPTYAEMLFLK